MKNIGIGLFILSTFILLGCSQVHDQQVWRIKNDSASDICVEFTHNLSFETKQDTVKVGEEKAVYYKEGIAEGEDIEDPTMYTHILIYNSTDTLVKDENLKSNWSISIEEMGRNAEAMDCEYVFSVCDSNF